MLSVTIQKSTSKGQLTLPKAWRSQFATSQFVVQPRQDSLVIKPLLLADLDDTVQPERVIFNAKRDNSGKGIPARTLLKILREIDGQD